MSARKHANVRFDQACAHYLERITNAGQSEFSIKTATYALARFGRTVCTKRDPNPFLHTITSAQADDYCYGPEGIRRGVKAITFNRYRSCLKLFFDYAMTMRWVDVNPFDGIDPARPDTPTTHLMLNAGELLALLDHAGNPIERVAMSIGMNTGLRANDIRHLTIFDASLAGGSIQTEIRKTRKLDVKPITMELHNELVVWLDLYAELSELPDRGALPNEWLLVPTYRTPMLWARDQRLVLDPVRMHTHPWRLVQRPLARMGYPTKGEGFHTLRRSSARALFESLRTVDTGRDHALMIVKEFLNHASTAQTEHYLGLNAERTIRDALLKDKPFLSAVAKTEQDRVASASVVDLTKGLRSA